MNAAESGCPVNWDAEKKVNIKWENQLGSQSYGNPVVAGGLVFVGTNNEGKRDPRYVEDGGVLMVFRESDGKFLWQRYSAKLKAGRVNDWPYQGVCSTVYAEGDFAWYCTNRCEVVCLNVSPLRRGDGEPKEVWVVDMMAQLGVFPHNMTACSIASWNDNIYVVTGNGVDDTHKNIPAPKAPAIVCFEKKTGKVVWSDNTPGENILHGQWSSPSIVTVNGRPLVIAGLGDSWVYAFDARDGKHVWWFDANPKETVYPTTRNEIIATPVIVGNRMFISVGQDPEHGEGPGHLWCVDITKTGDISLEVADAPKVKITEDAAAAAIRPKGQPNPNSAVVWHFDKLAGKPGRANRMNRSISSVAVTNGLVFAPDFSGYLHCLDADTGQQYWAHDTESAIWGSPLLVDGHVYLCNEEGDVTILEASRALRVIATHNLGSASYCSPVFVNGTLFLTSREHLFAIREAAAVGGAGR
jgi:outer membrane protein assembly factor BamB